MFEKIRQILNGDIDVPIEYIYYLVGLNIVTIFVFVFAIYYTQKIMNQEDEDNHESDTEESVDENGNIKYGDDSISGGTATTSSSSSDEGIQAQPKVIRRLRRRF